MPTILHARNVLWAALLAAAAGPACGEEWQHEIAPYLFAAGMDGTAGVGDVTADVDVSFGDVLENLKIGGMVAYRGTNGPYFVAVDAIYMDLEGDKTGPNGLIRGDAEIQQTALELDLGYNVASNLALFAGLRYNDIDAEVKVRGEGPLALTRSAKSGEDWLDPLVGARTWWNFAGNWTASLRGDIGGFGVGSDLAWQLVALVTWEISENWGIGGGYRYFDQDYDADTGQAFKYDVVTSGPTLGVVFKF